MSVFKNKKSFQRQKLRYAIFRELVKTEQLFSLMNLAKLERFIMTGRYQKKRERRKPSFLRVKD